MDANQCNDCGEIMKHGPIICPQCRGSNTVYFAKLKMENAQATFPQDGNCTAAIRGVN